MLSLFGNRIAGQGPIHESVHPAQEYPAALGLSRSSFEDAARAVMRGDSCLVEFERPDIAFCGVARKFLDQGGQLNNVIEPSANLGRIERINKAVFRGNTELPEDMLKALIADMTLIPTILSQFMNQDALRYQLMVIEPKYLGNPFPLPWHIDSSLENDRFIRIQVTYDSPGMLWVDNKQVDKERFDQLSKKLHRGPYDPAIQEELSRLVEGAEIHQIKPNSIALFTSGLGNGLIHASPVTDQRRLLLFTDANF